MDPFEIIKKYYDPASVAYTFLVEHGKAVAAKSLVIANNLGHLNPDTAFIEEAALLHDIGICMTDEPGLGCHGLHPYICHGYLGRELLEKEGLFRHALVCERHVGAGVGIDDIELHALPLPKRDMLPLSFEEKIICFADKFFSKRKGSLSIEKSTEDVRREMLKYGQTQLRRFDEMYDLLVNNPFQK